MPPERSRSQSTLHRLATQLWLSAVRLQHSSSRRSNRPGEAAFSIEADELLSVSLILCPDEVYSPSCALCCSFSFRKAVLDSGSKQSDAFRWDCSVTQSKSLAQQQTIFTHARTRCTQPIVLGQVYLTVHLPIRTV